MSIGVQQLVASTCNPPSMKWTWESMNPGSTTFPLRLSSCVWRPLSSCKHTQHTGQLAAEYQMEGESEASDGRDLDGLVGADAEHAAAADGHGVGERAGGVGGVDGGVGQDHVGEAVPRRRPCKCEERRAGQPLSHTRGEQERGGRRRSVHGKGRRTVAVAMATAAARRALWAAIGNVMMGIGIPSPSPSPN